MAFLKCKMCGNKIETIPQSCGYDINVDGETNDLICNMGPDIGYMKLSELICYKCADNIHLTPPK
jgi:hypothetical protein